MKVVPSESMKAPVSGLTDRRAGEIDSPPKGRRNKGKKDDSMNDSMREECSALRRVRARGNLELSLQF